ncbi:hypothetical protein NQ317_003812 [Molorchus minor]|uniref:Uncharacterized protein n=1 Tax=Molorchus minor TaxID=1323400 RepID=A0ABQ9JHR9_9CUCU|nr:hypothetical protein NQ317_003812 [Molorchus minor]
MDSDSFMTRLIPEQLLKLKGVSASEEVLVTISPEFFVVLGKFYSCGLCESAKSEADGQDFEGQELNEFTLDILQSNFISLIHWIPYVIPYK